MRFKLTSLVFALLGSAAYAQGPPPPPPQLPPVPVPAGNPITPNKVLLGKALFWDEQMSSTRTVACGSCHIPSAGSSDPRSTTAAANHPGPDGLFGTADDIFGSPGISLSNADGSYNASPSFRLGPQVTGRKTPSAINAAFFDRLFWDGRADSSFEDPVTGAVLLPADAALESQAAGPPLSNAEMGHLGRDWNDVAARIEASDPLALASDLPADLAAFVNGRTYGELFTDAFGTPGVTPARIIMAIATYERTLISDDAPIDQPGGGPFGPGPLTQQQNQGRNIFNGPGQCNVCHPGPLFSDDQFHYIGIRPVGEDLGRFDVSGNNPDRGSMRTPSLRNVSLRAPYFHNGRFATLEEVVDFYNRGGDFDAPNKAIQIQPLGLGAGQRAALVAFLEALTDPRVAAETAPFDRPTLYAETNRVPTELGVGTPGTGGFTPSIIAIEPPKIGNPNMTIGIDGGLAGAASFLACDIQSAPNGLNYGGTQVFIDRTSMLRIMFAGPLQGSGAGDGFDSVNLSVANDPTLIGTDFFCQWFVMDPDPSARFAASPAVEITWF